MSLVLVLLSMDVASGENSNEGMALLGYMAGNVMTSVIWWLPLVTETVQLLWPASNYNNNDNNSSNDNMTMTMIIMTMMMMMIMTTTTMIRNLIAMTTIKTRTMSVKIYLTTTKRTRTTTMALIMTVSKIQLVVYHHWRVLIAWATSRISSAVVIINTSRLLVISWWYSFIQTLRFAANKSPAEEPVS